MKMRTWRRRQRSGSDKVFDACNVILMLALLVVFVWPLWFIVIASFSDPVAVGMGKILLFPKGITFAGYKRLLQFSELWMGYGNTIFYSVVGTVLNMVMSVCFAYPLSNRDFLPRKVLLYLFVFTMYFSGGLIPTYLVVKRVGLLNTRWAMIVPGLISVYNCLVLRSYFMNSIPAELQEAATLDGANSAQYLWRVVLPLSKPVLAVVSLYYFVAHWNDFYTALIYLYDDSLYPLQSVLRELLLRLQSLINNNALAMGADDLSLLFEQVDLMKYCIIIVAAVPVLCIYPFIQKFFVKGVMVGSVKG